MKALFTLLGSLLVGGLVLLGIGGVAYHLFRENGLLSQGMGALWEAHYEAPVLTIVLIVAAFFVFKTLHSAQIGGKRESKIPAFSFSAAGLPPAASEQSAHDTNLDCSNPLTEQLHERYPAFQQRFTPLTRRHSRQYRLSRRLDRR
jgi:hypothetical protein